MAGYGVLTGTKALLQSWNGVPSRYMAFSLAISFTLTMLPLHFHGACSCIHSVSQRLYLLKACWRHNDTLKDAVQSLCKRHRQPQRLNDHPRARLWSMQSSYCIVGDLTAWLWWPYGDPIVLLLKCQATVFVLSMLKVRAVIQSSMQFHSIYWWCNCLAAVMLAIVPQRSAFS